MKVKKSNTLLMKVKEGVEEGVDMIENAHRTATGTTYATYRNIKSAIPLRLR